MSRTQLVRIIAQELGIIAGENVETYNLNSYQLLESILISIRNIGSVGNGSSENTRVKVNTEIITANKQLSVYDAIVQNFIVNGDVEVFFPPAPKKDLNFAIKNSSLSTALLTVDGNVLSKGETYEAIYDGYNWIEI